jgi:type IV secretory pathway VirB6-like protein
MPSEKIDEPIRKIEENVNINVSDAILVSESIKVVLTANTSKSGRSLGKDSNKKIASTLNIRLFEKVFHLSVKDLVTIITGFGSVILSLIQVFFVRTLGPAIIITLITLILLVVFILLVRRKRRDIQADTN